MAPKTVRGTPSINRSRRALCAEAILTASSKRQRIRTNSASAELPAADTNIRMTSVTRIGASEPVTEPDRRLGAMGHAIVSLRLQEVEGRTVVDESPILGSHEQAVSNVEVGARAIDERRASL